MLDPATGQPQTLLSDLVAIRGAESGVIAGYAALLDNGRIVTLSPGCVSPGEPGYDVLIAALFATIDASSSGLPGGRQPTAADFTPEAVSLSSTRDRKLRMDGVEVDFGNAQPRHESWLPVDIHRGFD